jgi:hypothetical protein
LQLGHHTDLTAALFDAFVLTLEGAYSCAVRRVTSNQGPDNEKIWAAEAAGDNKTC